MHEKSLSSPARTSRISSSSSLPSDRLQQRLGSFTAVHIRDKLHALSLLRSAHRYRCNVPNAAYVPDVESRGVGSVSVNVSVDPRFSKLPSVSDRPMRPYSVMIVQLSLVHKQK
jgi:hypothetical protein